MTRLIGIDLGDRRVGVAVSDPLGITAQPLLALDRKDPMFWEKLAGIIGEKRAGKIVLGLPLNMDGSEGERALGARAFAEEVKKRTGLAVELVDERLTTKQVESQLIAADISREKRKKLLDAMSAQIILQTYLDSRKNGR